MNKLNALLVLTLLSLLTIACSDRHDDFGHFARIGSDGWAYGDTVAIDVTGLDSVPRPRRLQLGVRHSNDYEYRNVILEITYPDGNKLHRDTIDMELADIYGSWLGSGIGPTYQHATTVCPTAISADSFRITVRHVMRVDTLRGIEQVGIIVDNP